MSSRRSAKWLLLGLVVVACGEQPGNSEPTPDEQRTATAGGTGGLDAHQDTVRNLEDPFDQLRLELEDPAARELFDGPVSAVREAGLVDRIVAYQDAMGAIVGADGNFEGAGTILELEGEHYLCGFAMEMAEVRCGIEVPTELADDAALVFDERAGPQIGRTRYLDWTYMTVEIRAGDVSVLTLRAPSPDELAAGDWISQPMPLPEDPLAAPDALALAAGVQIVEAHTSGRTKQAEIMIHDDEHTTVVEIYLLYANVEALEHLADVFGTEVLAYTLLQPS